jgi:hypothetical protein
MAVRLRLRLNPQQTADSVRLSQKFKLLTANKMVCQKLPVPPSVQADCHYPDLARVPRPDLQSRTGRNRFTASSQLGRFLSTTPKGRKFRSVLAGPLQ